MLDDILEKSKQLLFPASAIKYYIIWKSTLKAINYHEVWKMDIVQLYAHSPISEIVSRMYLWLKGISWGFKVSTESHIWPIL